MQKALGAPIREFSFNRWWAAFYAFGVVMFAVVGIAVCVTEARKDTPFWAAGFMGVLSLASAYMVVRTLTARAVVHESGISYRTLQSRGEMLWTDIEGYRYSVLKTYHQVFIPTTHYTITLLDAAGNKAELGSNIQSPKELADLLWKKLHSVLLDKMTARLDAHQPVQLDRLKLTNSGVELKPPIGKTVFVPVERLAGCRLHNGMLQVLEAVNGKQKTHALMLTNLYNVFPLLEIVNNRFHREALAAVAR